VRVDAVFGYDTGMYLVDVFLETEQEQALGVRELWDAVRAELTRQAVAPGDVVDFFVYLPDGAGGWKSAGVSL
jgi:hypothetical protein